MAKNFSENYFFVKVGEDPLVTITGHEYATNRAASNWEERNGKIEVSCSEFELVVSLSKEDLKKLIVEVQEFLKKSA